MESWSIGLLCRPRRRFRCAIYTRQSVDSQDNLSSCQGQFEAVSAPEIESVMLEAAGLERTGLTSKEAETALRGALRQVVFKADIGPIEILFRPTGSAPASPPGGGIFDEA